MRPYAAKGGLVQPREVDADSEVLTGNMHWMREKWRELMLKFYGQEPSRSPPALQPPGMDDVVAEMRQRLKVCRTSSVPSLMCGQLICCRPPLHVSTPGTVCGTALGLSTLYGLWGMAHARGQRGSLPNPSLPQAIRLLCVSA